MENFERYFLHEKKVFLDNISYETFPLTQQPPEKLKLNCKDTIVAQLNRDSVKINFNRTLKFLPDSGPFSLSVTFAALLIFDPSTKDEIDWKNTDIAGEFRKGCPQLLNVLMSRTSLMVGEITSAAGQPPLMTPAAVQPSAQ